MFAKKILPGETFTEELQNTFSDAQKAKNKGYRKRSRIEFHKEHVQFSKNNY